MKDKDFYLKDSKKFWENREKAREARDKDLARLTFSEKAGITEKLQTDYKTLQNAKEEPKQFGLGEIPPDAMNELSLEQSFTQEDFDEALDKAFPF
ncbi:hypothetical protein ES703_59427 [subsurface metagenome]